MKIVLTTVAIVVLAVTSVTIYYLYGRPTSYSPETPPANSNNVPVAVSSYGKGAPNQETAPGAPVATPPAQSAIGVLMGQAKRAPGSSAALNFFSIKVALSDPKTSALLTSTNLKPDGSYEFKVTPGEYVLSIVQGNGKSDQLPQRIYVGANEKLNVNFFVR